MGQRRRRSSGQVEPLVKKTDEEWARQLTPVQHAVLRRSMTERPFTGEYVHCHDDGTYRCAGCGAALFASSTKFDSKTGWPSFSEPAAEDAVTFHRDFSHLSIRTEVRCRACGGHLGHVFLDFRTATRDRFCINSHALALDRETAPQPSSRPGGPGLGS
jgi:peptide-methionine (R)-S-oxide reductase